MSSGRPSRALSAAAILAAAQFCTAQDAPDPSGETPIDRPAASRRIVHQFDFDRPEPFALPRYWDLAQDGSRSTGKRPGFPLYNGAEHDMSAAFRGQGSVRLFTRGGSTCLRLDPAVIPVFPETEYLVSAKVRTRRLSSARAAISARYLDKASRPIPGVEARSDLVVTGPDEWQLISVQLPGGLPEAAYIQIDLELLQPDQFQPARLGRHQVWPNDFPGDAWFDDVTVVQLPRVSIATNAPANLIRQDQRPAISVTIRDLSGEPVTGRLVLQDAAGRTIDQTTRPITAGMVTWAWEPRVDRLGWYRATLELTTQNRRVGGTCIDFAWLPAHTIPNEAAAADRARFAIVLDELPAASRDSLAVILDRIGSGAVTIPVWSALQTPESTAALAKDLVRTVTDLKSSMQDVSFSLPRVPAQLAEACRIEAEEPLQVFAGEESRWIPYILPLVDKYGQSVQRWQIGRIGDPAPEGQSAADLSRLQSMLARLVPGPVVALPWPAEVAPAAAQIGPGVGDLIACLPYSADPDALAPLAQAWRESLGARPPAITAAIEPLPESQFSRHDAAVHLAKVAVEAWGALVTGSDAPRGSLSLVQPWSWPTPGRDQAQPRPELAVYANLIERLAERRIVGTLPVGPGVRCYILSPAQPGSGRTGALVAWRDGIGGDTASIDAFLGDGHVIAYDIWGNARPVEPRRDAPGPARDPGTDPRRSAVSGLTHHIDLTGEPVFIENVNVDLARFIASFRLDPGFLPSTASEHDVAIILSNPFRSRAEGRITILEPGGLSVDPSNRDRTWRIAPRTSPFSIGPGETARIPISVAFSSAEEAGLKPVLAEVEFVADRDYGPLRLRSALEVRLDQLQLDLSYRLVPGGSGADLIVEGHVTNMGKAAVTLELSAFAPGYPRAKASIAELAPGQTITRRFAFPGGATRLRDERVIVGAQDIETLARINRSIGIE